MPEFLDEAREIPVAGRVPSQPFRVLECGPWISGLAAEAYDCQRGVAIGRMPNQSFFQNGHCLLAAPR